MTEHTTSEKKSDTKVRLTKKPGTTKQSKKGIFTIIIILAVIAVGFYLVKSGKISSKESSNLDIVSEIDPSDTDQFSYAIGYALGKQLEQSVLQIKSTEDLNNKIVAQAVTDVLTGNDLALTEEQAQDIFVKRDELNAAQAEELAQPNMEAGEAFRAQYKEQEGVEELESGVLVTSLAEGEGEVVGDNIAYVNYVGKHIDGSVFDASEEGQPVPMQVAQLVPGFGQALAEMKAGDKWEIVIPSDLAYGSAGAPDIIEPGETLLFEVEVTEIMSLEELQAQQDE